MYCGFYYPEVKYRNSRVANIKDYTFAKFILRFNKF